MRGPLRARHARGLGGGGLGEGGGGDGDGGGGEGDGGGGLGDGGEGDGGGGEGGGIGDSEGGGAVFTKSLTRNMWPTQASTAVGENRVGAFIKQYYRALA